MTHPPSGPQTPPPPPGPKYCGATAVIPRLNYPGDPTDVPKPTPKPGTPPPPRKPKVSAARFAQVGAGLVVGASLAVAGLQLMGGGG